MKSIFRVVAVAIAMLMATGCMIDLNRVLIKDDGFSRLPETQRLSEYKGDFVAFMKKSPDYKPVEVVALTSFDKYVSVTFSRSVSDERPACAKSRPNEMTYSRDDRTPEGVSFGEILWDAKQDNKKVLVYGLEFCLHHSNIEVIGWLMKDIDDDKPSDKARSKLANSPVLRQSVKANSEKASQPPTVNIQTLTNFDGYMIATFSRAVSYKTPECAKNHPNEISLSNWDTIVDLTGRPQVAKILWDAKGSNKNFLIFGTGRCSHDPNIETFDDLRVVEE